MITLAKILAICKLAARNSSSSQNTPECEAPHKQLVTDAHGKTVWEDKPFYEGTVTEGSDTLTWDGSTDGKMIVNNAFVKISDAVVTVEDCKNGYKYSIAVADAREEYELPSYDDDMGDAIVLGDGALVCVNKDGFALGEFVFPEKGVYIAIQYTEYAPVIVTIPGYTGFVTTKTVVKLLDKKYLPDDTSKVTPTDWNAAEGEPGHITNRTHYVEKNAELLIDWSFTTEYDGEFYSESDAHGTFEPGKLYTVIFDGVEYKDLTAYWCEWYWNYALGNPVLCGNEEAVDNGLPFHIEAYGGDGVYDVFVSTIGSHTLSVYGDKIHTLDSKFLPVGISPGTGKNAEVFNGGRTESASGENSHAEGYDPLASGESAHAEGYRTEARGDGAHSEGRDSVANGNASHAENTAKVYSYNAHGEGQAEVYGMHAHGEGSKAATSSAWVPVVSGEANATRYYLRDTYGGILYKYENIALNALVSYGNTIARVVDFNLRSSQPYFDVDKTLSEAAIDNETVTFSYHAVSGEGAHLEGGGNYVYGDFAHGEGEGTRTFSPAQHVQGKYNIPDTESKYAHIVGNGTDWEHRSNAHTLDWDGNAWFAGSVEGTALILKSPSGKRFQITVDDSGTLSAVEI